MTLILIGSRALVLRAPQVLNRKPLDFDFLCTRSDYDSWMEQNVSKIKSTKMYAISDSKLVVEGSTNCEFELIVPGTSSELLSNLVTSDPNSLDTPFGLVPSFDLLFTIKSSHKYLKNSPHFWKTMSDYHRMKLTGAIVRPEYQEFLKLREKETYTYAHPKLNQSKVGFFSDDQITYQYDHDSIHQAVKLQDRPAYSYFQKDEAEVACSKDKFFACSEEIRDNSVIEESAVLAIERSLVPHPGVLSTEQAWRLAFSKVCSSIASGWWRAYAYDNALRILKRYQPDYFDKFKVGLADGVVKPFTGTTY